LPDWRPPVSCRHRIRGCGDSWDALNGMPYVADARGFRFADPATGKEVWLSDVP